MLEGGVWGGLEVCERVCERAARAGRYASRTTSPSAFIYPARFFPSVASKKRPLQGATRGLGNELELIRPSITSPSDPKSAVEIAIRATLVDQERSRSSLTGAPW